MIDLLTKHIDDPVTCENGCGVFWNLMSDRKNENKDFHSISIHFNLIRFIFLIANNSIGKELKAEVVKIIVNAINVHGKNNKICKVACNILFDMTSAGKKSNKTKIKRSINCLTYLAEIKAVAGENGAIEVIATSMGFNCNDFLVCRSGLGCLMNLTSDSKKKKTSEKYKKFNKTYLIQDDNKVLAGHLEILQNIVKVMNAQMDNPEVCKYACGTLKNIVFECKQKNMCVVLAFIFLLNFKKIQLLTERLPWRPMLSLLLLLR